MLTAGAVLVPLMLQFFKTRFDWLDIVVAALGGAAAVARLALIPLFLLFKTRN